MRLIDADALIETMEFHVTTMSVCSTTIEARAKGEMKRTCIADAANAPTIDAIPVEWLREIADGNDFVTGRAARLILHAWEQDNNPSPTCGPDYCDIK